MLLHCAFLARAEYYFEICKSATNNIKFQQINRMALIPKEQKSCLVIHGLSGHLTSKKYLV